LSGAVSVSHYVCLLHVGYSLILQDHYFGYSPRHDEDVAGIWLKLNLDHALKNLFSYYCGGKKLFHKDFQTRNLKKLYDFFTN